MAAFTGLLGPYFDKQDRRRAAREAPIRQLTQYEFERATAELRELFAANYVDESQSHEVH